MNDFERDLIRSVFTRRFALKETLIEAVNENDKQLIEAITDSLSQQSGLRVKFIKDNLKEIVEL